MSARYSASQIESVSRQRAIPVGVDLAISAMNRFPDARQSIRWMELWGLGVGLYKNTRGLLFILKIIRSQVCKKPSQELLARS